MKAENVPLYYAADDEAVLRVRKICNGLELYERLAQFPGRDARVSPLVTVGRHPKHTEFVHVFLDVGLAAEPGHVNVDEHPDGGLIQHRSGNFVLSEDEVALDEKRLIGLVRERSAACVGLMEELGPFAASG